VLSINHLQSAVVENFFSISNEASNWAFGRSNSINQFRCLMQFSNSISGNKLPVGVDVHSSMMVCQTRRICSAVSPPFKPFQRQSVQVSKSIINSGTRPESHVLNARQMKRMVMDHLPTRCSSPATHCFYLKPSS
jgi:hypothetical protein